MLNSLVLGYDKKRLHLFHEMHHGVSGGLVATNEVMLLHVYMKTRKTAEFPSVTLNRIANTCRLHQKQGVPEHVGRAVKFLPASGQIFFAWTWPWDGYAPLNTMGLKY